MSLNLKDIKTNHLRRFRKKQNLRQRDIKELIELSDLNSIYRWEKGEKIPKLINALKLSVALDCPVEVLFFDHFQQIRKEMLAKKQELKIKQKNNEQK